MATPFRIQPAPPEALHTLEASAPAELREHLRLIKRGLEAIPGVPGDALYGAVTLRTLALKPDLFRSWFLMEHYAVKHGEIESSTKELLAAVISWRNEGDETPTCAPYHEGAARFEGADEAAIAVARDWEEKSHLVSERERDLVDFGVKVAFAPRQIGDEDVARVRRHGVSDAGLVELASAALIAYNLSALNRAFNLVEGQG
ncbi:MAG: carboxymuconolactone decarboxylase family protein [Candidatus Binatia bacterium]